MWLPEPALFVNDIHRVIGGHFAFAIPFPRDRIKVAGLALEGRSRSAQIVFRSKRELF